MLVHMAVMYVCWQYPPFLIVSLFLTAEQIARIAENKRLAQERLAAKKTHTTISELISDNTYTVTHKNILRTHFYVKF